MRAVMRAVFILTLVSIYLFGILYIVFNRLDTRVVKDRDCVEINLDKDIKVGDTISVTTYEKSPLDKY